MKFLKYINEENIVTKALGLPEPKVGGDYADEKVKRYLDIIEQALKAMSKKEENDTNDAIVQDLRNKKKAWQNVDKETKPVKVKKEEPVEPPEEEPEEPQQEPPPQEEG